MNKKLIIQKITWLNHLILPENDHTVIRKSVLFSGSIFYMLTDGWCDVIRLEDSRRMIQMMIRMMILMRTKRCSHP